MNIDEAVARSCQEPTLLDALSWIAVWETERVIKQAQRFFETGERTGSNGAGWDTCFRVCFERVIGAWQEKGQPVRNGKPVCGVWTEWGQCVADVPCQVHHKGSEKKS